MKSSGKKEVQILILTLTSLTFFFIFFYLIQPWIIFLCHLCTGFVKKKKTNVKLRSLYSSYNPSRARTEHVPFIFLLTSALFGKWIGGDWSRWGINYTLPFPCVWLQRSRDGFKALSGWISTDWHLVVYKAGRRGGRWSDCAQLWGSAGLMRFAVTRTETSLPQISETSLPQIFTLQCNGHLKYSYLNEAKQI